MTLNEFFQWEKVSRDTIDVKRIYIDIAGDLVTGVLLSQIIYWNLPNKETGKTKLRAMIDGELYLAKKRTDWWEECRISDRQYDRSIKVLVDKGIVDVRLKKFDGIPMPHIRINDVILKFIENEINGIGVKVDFTESVKTSNNAPLTDFTESVNYTKCKVDITESVKSLTETTTEIINHNNNGEQNGDNWMPEWDELVIPNESSTIDLAFERVFKIYEREFGREIKGFDAESLQKIYDDAGEEKAIYALKKAISAGIRNFRYIDSIVREWEKKGLRSIHEIQEEDKKFEQSQDMKKQSYSSPKNTQAPEKPKSTKYEKFYL
jgi:DnaD/phage-associated family protein